MSVEDAASPIRWLRIKATMLGIDPKRVVAAGASAGGTAAAVIGVTDEFDARDEDRSIPSRPDALVLLNPAMGTVLLPPGAQKPAEEVVRSWAQMYAHFERPAKGNPPTIMFFGTKDSLLAPGKTYFHKTLGAGNLVELFLAPGVGHGFFNDPRSSGADGKLAQPGWHEAVLHKMVNS
jgi:acetyl esterase